MSEEQTTIHRWDVSETREYAIVQDANGVIHIYKIDDTVQRLCTTEVSPHEVATGLLTELITAIRIKREEEDEYDRGDRDGFDAAMRHIKNYIQEYLDAPDE